MKTKFILLLFAFLFINGIRAWGENHNVYNVKVDCPSQVVVGNLFKVEYTVENLPPEITDEIKFELESFEPDVKLVYDERSLVLTECGLINGKPFNNSSVTWTFTFGAFKKGIWYTPQISVFTPAKLNLNQTKCKVEIIPEEEEDSRTFGNVVE